MMTALLLLLACSGGGGSEVADASEDSGGEEATLELDLNASLSEVIPSVVTVSFTSPSNETAFVEFGDELEHRATATLGEDGTWSATLVGFPEEHEARFRVRQGDEVSQVATLQTGAAANWVPRAPEITGEGHPGFVVTGYRSNVGRGALIVDDEGRPVWWFSMEAFGADAYTSRVALAPDRSGVLISIIKLRSAPADADAELGVAWVSFDGTEVEHWSLPGHHHDFWMHEDGSIVFLSEYEGVSEEGIAGVWDDIQVRDPDGTIRQLWSSLEIIPPDLGSAFLNTLEYVEESDSFWVSSKSQGKLVHLDATTGETLAVLGRGPVEYEVEDEFEEQHGFDVVGDEILLFDNGSISEMDSRAVRYALDDEAGTGTVVWEYRADPSMYTNFLGDALLLPDERVLINWTSPGYVAQVSEAGEMLSEWTYDPSDLEMLTFMRFEETVVP